MKMLTGFSDLLNKLCTWFMIILTVVLTVCLVLLIAGRNFFLTSFAELEEVSRFILVAMTFLGSTICHKRMEHMGVDYFVTRFTKGKMIKAVFVYKEIVTLILFLIMMYYGWELVSLNLHQTSLQAQIPMSYVYFVIPLSGFIMVVHALDHIFSSSRNQLLVEMHPEGHAVA